MHDQRELNYTPSAQTNFNVHVHVYSSVTGRDLRVTFPPPVNESWGSMWRREKRLHPPFPKEFGPVGAWEPGRARAGRGKITGVMESPASKPLSRSYLNAGYAHPVSGLAWIDRLRLLSYP